MGPPGLLSGANIHQVNEEYWTCKPLLIKNKQTNKQQQQKAKLVRCVWMQKKNGFIQILYYVGEWGTPCLKAHLLCKTQPSSA